MKILEVQILLDGNYGFQWHMALLLYCGNFFVHFTKLYLV
jgi:hypothetical protein